MFKALLYRLFLFLLPVFWTLAGRGQGDDLHFDPAADAWKNISTTLRLIRQDQVALVARRVSYPLTRENPLPDIRGRNQFSHEYGVLLDSTLKRALFRLKAGDMFEHEGNWSYGEGDVWFDPDGKIVAINYSSPAERRRKDSLTEETYRVMYPGIAHWKRNVLMCKVDNRLIRVDEVGDDLRYIAWGPGKTVSDKPDMVLFKGDEEADGTNGSYTIAFTNGPWTYTFDYTADADSGDDFPAGLYLLISNNKKQIARYACRQIKSSIGEGFSQRTVVPAGDRHISYEGRILMTKDAAVLMWPGTAVRVGFVGTGLSGEIKDQDTSNYYNVIVDGKVRAVIHPDTARKDYVLAGGLPYGKHSVELFKRTEWDKGKTWFYGFSFEGKTVLVDPPAKPVRKMEFFGNSITCGYAISDRAGDSPTGYFENNYDSYAAITARHFNAQCHYTAKSGIGIMVSWFPLIMPEMYNRLDPTDPDSRWDFSTYVPDLVVINLLQNDAWITNMPNNEQFKARFGTQRPSEDFIIQSYRNFVRTVREVYPKAQIICMLGNMDITREGSPWPGYVQKAVQGLNDPRIFTLVVPYKNTPGHPKTEEQKAMAETLIEFIDRKIRW